MHTKTKWTSPSSQHSQPYVSLHPYTPHCSYVPLIPRPPSSFHLWTPPFFLHRLRKFRFYSTDLTCWVLRDDSFTFIDLLLVF